MERFRLSNVFLTQSFILLGVPSSSSTRPREVVTSSFAAEFDKQMTMQICCVVDISGDDHKDSTPESFTDAVKYGRMALGMAAMHFVLCG